MARMCADEWMQSMGIDLWDEDARARIEATQWSLSKELLLVGRDVVIEWGTWARVERDVLHDWCRAHGVGVSLVHLDVPLHEIAGRLAVRNTAPGETAIPPEMVEEWHAGPFQAPTEDELATYDQIDVPGPTVLTRPWLAADIPFLWDMLHSSIHVPAGQEPLPRTILDQPGLSHYLHDFGRHEGDDAEVALLDTGERVGAAFCRALPADDRGYGWVADDIPEVGMAVVGEWRGRGAGTALVKAMFERHPTLSLSVDRDNAGARRLYESLGFVEVGDDGHSLTMLRSPG
jgi:GNAT superfamily N-acetyltransferase/predicted kinase